MSQCVTVTAEGYLVQSTESPDQCTGYLLISPSEYQLFVQTVEITPAEVLEVFGIVFGWVVLLGALSYKVKVARNVVKST